MPKRSCAIDFMANLTEYNWYWEQKLQWPWGYPMPGHHLYGKVDPKEFIEAPETDEDETPHNNSPIIPVRQAIETVIDQDEKKLPKIFEKEEELGNRGGTGNSKGRRTVKEAIFRIREQRERKISLEKEEALIKTTRIFPEWIFPA